MTDNHTGEPTRETCLRVAREAAELATAADEKALNAACRSSSRTQARLEAVMHAVHREAVEAQRHAEYAEQLAADPGAPDSALRHRAAWTVDRAVRAQEASGGEATAAALRAELERKLTPGELAERESRRRRAEAEREAEERAATGLDADNRHQAAMNMYFAQGAVPLLGWTVGHVRALGFAATGRLYQRDGQVRQAAEHGVWSGGRRVSRERVQALHAAGFLIAAEADGVRVLKPSLMGQVALELARLYPAGLYESDRAAYEARYALVAKRYKRKDDKKAAARRLLALEYSAARNYRRPVTLAQQEARAAREAAEQWEGEGGYCPGVETPRPADGPASAPAPVQMVSVSARRPARERRCGPGVHRVTRRPQRLLTPQERERVQDMPLLNLQGALIMGITDPVPNASPMPEDAGAWVREQVWPHHFRDVEDRYPFGFHRWSMCERGTCWSCLSGRHDICVHRQKGGPDVDGNRGWVTNQQGRVVAPFIPRPGGEPCVWWCRCECPKGAGPARRAKPKPAPPVRSAPVPVRAAALSRASASGLPQDSLW
ncbi:DUF6248 family natural product biosynthesis protein [Streptomyces sp. NPDC018007]|uniref:DUF6248 family natural product biosynthesis protein n=1 Tax=Streptomyces sp. NPDC018007 TaxID=3365029 RepID=UPI00379F9056